MSSVKLHRKRFGFLEIRRHDAREGGLLEWRWSLYAQRARRPAQSRAAPKYSGPKARTTRMRAAFVLLLTACATRASLTRDELIARHTQAVGGAKAIEAVERLEIELRISEGKSTLRGVWRGDRQGRMRIDVYAGGHRVYTEAFDGKRGWQMDAKGVVTPSAQAGAAALWHGTQYPDRLLGLHEMEGLGHSLQMEGRETLDGIDYYVLKLTLSDGFVTFRYVNPRDWLIDRGRDLRAIHPDLDARKKWLENLWSEWRPVAGVLRNFHEDQVDVPTGRVLQTTDVTRIDVNSAFPAGLFSEISQ